MTDCEFCAIAEGEADASVLYENAETIAFLDSDPAIAGHTLVVPKRHQESLVTGPETTLRAVIETVHTVATAMEAALDVDGFSLFHTSGVLVGHISHAHVHLLPRFADDDIRIALQRHDVATELSQELAVSVRRAL